MKHLLALLAAYVLAQDDDSIYVTMDTSDEHVKKGDSVVFTCHWQLNMDYDDYDEDNFQLYWKLSHTLGVQTVASWEPAPEGEQEEPVYYLSHMLQDRVVVVPSFEDRNATLEVSDLRIADDNMEITCEIHWGRHFQDGIGTINVYVDADNVDLDQLDDSLEGRDRDNNGTLEEADPEQEVAMCTVSHVYPKPETIAFIVGDELVEVDVDEDDEDDENDDGTFTVSATLVLAPEGSYNGDEVSCQSVAAPGADEIVSDDNSTFTLEVFYYTNEVTLTIGGDAQDLGNGGYSVIENHLYTVTCQANGNPPPEITIRNAQGQELDNGASTTAARILEDGTQQITCTAHNNDDDDDDEGDDEGFSQGDFVTGEAELDVYYITDVDLGEDVEGEYNSEFTKECNVQGKPEPKIEWTKAPNTERVLDEGDLQLGALTYDDAGVYTCTASNAAGSREDDFELTVNGPCIVKIEGVNAGSSQEVPGQASLELQCSVQGTACEIDWGVKDLEPEFISTGDIVYDNGVSTLTFSSFETFASPPTFTCSATNDKGTKVDEVMIDDNEDPACCAPGSTASLGTGAIVGIVIAIPAILIIIGAAVFFCRKRNDDKNSDTLEEGDDAEANEKQPLQADHDGEGGNAGDDDAV